jgi:hypothetical protein
MVEVTRGRGGSTSTAMIAPTFSNHPFAHAKHDFGSVPSVRRAVAAQGGREMEEVGGGGGRWEGGSARPERGGAGSIEESNE